MMNGTDENPYDNGPAPYAPIYTFNFYSITGQKLAMVKCDGSSKLPAGVSFVLGHGAECVLREQSDHIGRRVGRVGPSGQCTGELAGITVRILPIWGGAHEHGRQSREIRHVLPGRNRAGLRGSAILRCGDGRVLESGPWWHRYGGFEQPD